VGTFQFFAARGDVEALKNLADHVIARHYPQAAEAANPYRALLDLVIARQVDLIAKWMLIGFIHGVMNTDNMSIAGETIDYGPCAFMDAYDPATVYSSIDEGGRYAFGNQPRIAQWNLARLAETLLPLLASNPDEAIKHAQAAIDGFGAAFEQAYVSGLWRKIGLLQSRPEDTGLIEDLLQRMTENRADFTLTFRALCDAAVGQESDSAARALFNSPNAFDAWAAKWRARLAEEGGDPSARREAMRAVNPRYIPRNHRVEEAIAAAVRGDYAPFETLVAVLSKPFDDQPDFARYADPPRPEEVVHQTFCGT
jgi:uncharacterized protein YdiU (UPF0061 family)